MRNRGFTLIEVIVVLGVLATLMAFASINVLQLQRHTHVQTVVTTLATDLYEQRQKSMTGDTQGRATSDSYGIFFETDRYVLFHGTSYATASADNVAIAVPSPIQISGTSLPGSTIIFTKGSGEISGFSSGASSITLANTANTEQVTLTLNKYGTIISDLP